MHTALSTVSIALGPVRLAVRSLAQTGRFYRETLGLRVLARDDGRLALGAAAEAGPLVVLEERPLADPPPSTAGLFHLALLLPDRASLGRLGMHLAAAGQPFTTGDHGVSEALYLEDPEGNGLELYVDRPRAAWPAPRGADRVPMITAPVDLAALWASARAAPDQPLVPPQTRLGHLHLCTPDLGAAERFLVDELGATVTMQSLPGARFFGWDGYHHQLAANTWRHSLARRLPRPTHGWIDCGVRVTGADGTVRAGRLAFDAGGALGFTPAAGGQAG